MIDNAARNGFEKLTHPVWFLFFLLLFVMVVVVLFFPPPVLKKSEGIVRCVVDFHDREDVKHLQKFKKCKCNVGAQLIKFVLHGTKIHNRAYIHSRVLLIEKRVSFCTVSEST